MKTQITKTGDTIIVNMKGYLDFETHIPLREDLSKLLNPDKTEDSTSKIIFNFEKLEFVGSSGISSFVNTLKEFNTRLPTRPKYCHVRSEFQKIIKAFDEEELFEIYDTLDGAQQSFDL